MFFYNRHNARRKPFLEREGVTFFKDSSVNVTGADSVLGAFPYYCVDEAKVEVRAYSDIFGLSPLFFCLRKVDNDNYEIGFDFSIKAFFISGFCKPEMNLAKIRTYLDSDSNGILLGSQTFVKNIYRLLPCHELILKNGQIAIKPRKEFDFSKYKNLSENSYPILFKDAFEESVLNCLGATTHCASTLSGGLDSSSVTAVAQSFCKEPIAALHFDIQSKFANEANFAEAVSAKTGAKLIKYYAKDTIYELVRDNIGTSLLPISAILPGVFSQFHENVKAANASLLLAGEGGDQVVQFGFEYLDELYENKDWDTLSSAMRQFVSLRNLERVRKGLSSKSQAKKIRYCATLFFLKKISKRKGSFFEAIWHLNKDYGCWGVEVFEIALGRLFRKKIDLQQKRAKLYDFSRIDTVKNESLEFFNKRLKAEELVQHPITATEKDHLESCYSEFVTCAMEDYLVYCTAEGIEMKYPFFNKELLEIGLATPLKVKFRDGYGRGLIREAMKEYLPEEVRMRTTKANFVEYSHSSFKSLWRDIKKHIDIDTCLIWGIVDKNAFDSRVEVILDNEIPVEKKSRIMLEAFRVLYLIIWLDVMEEKGYKLL